MRKPPRTPEQLARDVLLQQMVDDAVAKYNALSPVDRAIADLEQRTSFGDATMPPEFVMLAAYRKVVAHNEELKTYIKKLEKLIG